MDSVAGHVECTPHAFNAEMRLLCNVGNAGGNYFDANLFWSAVVLFDAVGTTGLLSWDAALKRMGMTMGRRADANFHGGGGGGDGGGDGAATARRVNSGDNASASVARGGGDTVWAAIGGGAGGRGRGRGRDRGGGRGGGRDGGRGDAGFTNSRGNNWTRHVTVAASLSPGCNDHPRQLAVSQPMEAERLLDVDAQHRKLAEALEAMRQTNIQHRVSLAARIRECESAAAVARRTLDTTRAPPTPLEFKETPDLRLGKGKRKRPRAPP
jgi:hypothetical protein